MRLKSYLSLNEASFRNNDLERVVKLLLNVLSRKTGYDFAPFGGKNQNFEKFSRSSGNGIGMVYVLNDGQLVRFNWEKSKKSSTISSIDIWNSMRSEKVDYSLEIPKDFNIIQSVKSIVNFIKKPSVAVPIIEMAAKGQYGPKRYADAERYGIPVDHPKFRSEVAKAKTAEKKGFKKGFAVRKNINETSTRTKEYSNGSKLFKSKKVADPSVIFDDLSDLVKMVSSGIQKSLLITGMAGIGKTYTVTKEVTDMLGPKGNKWVLIKGKTSPLGLYSALFLNRDKLILFDDIDSVFANKDTVNMIKAAVDSYDERIISWISPVTVDVSKLDAKSLQKLYDDIDEKLSTDPTNSKIKYPNQFPFTGKVIFISNINESKMDSAIKSRSFVIDITLEAKDVFNRMESILPDLLPESSMNDKQAVLDFLKEKNKDNKKPVDIRTLINGIKCKESGSARWKHLAEFYA